jgi:hypothetical protein
MPLFSHTKRTATVVVALLLGACNAPAPPQSASTGTGSTNALFSLGDDGHGDGYEYRIRYPELAPEWDVLARALREYAALHKRGLLASVPAAGERASNAAPAVLDLEFNVARRTDDFVSVLAQGSVHTGNGGEPLAASFVLHTGDNRLLAIEDLFVDPAAALNTLSDECGRQLQGRYEAGLRQSVDARGLAAALKAMQAGVEHGTAPTAQNFSVFLVDGIDTKAIGLTLFFSQAQLGVSSGGEQQVEVPAKVFYDLLKPEYRDAFSVDLKEVAPGVR